MASDQEFDMLQPLLLVLYILAIIFALQLIWYYIARRVRQWRRDKQVLPNHTATGSNNSILTPTDGQIGLRSFGSETTLKTPAMVYSKETEIVLNRFEKSLDRQDQSRETLTRQKQSGSLPRSEATYHRRSQSFDDDTTGPLIPPRSHSANTFRAFDSSFTDEDLENITFPERISSSRAEIKANLKADENTYSDKRSTPLPAYLERLKPVFEPTPAIPSLARKGMLDVLKNRKDQANPPPKPEQALPTPTKKKEFYPVSNLEEQKTIPSLARNGMLDVLKNRAGQAVLPTKVESPLKQKLHPETLGLGHQTSPSLSRTGMLDVLKNRVDQPSLPPSIDLFLNDEETFVYPDTFIDEPAHILSLSRTGMLDVLKNRVDQPSLPPNIDSFLDEEIDVVYPVQMDEEPTHMPSLARTGMLDVLKNRTGKKTVSPKVEAPYPPKLKFPVKEEVYPMSTLDELTRMPSLARTGMLDILKRRGD